jgi:hypothetical protein
MFDSLLAWFGGMAEMRGECRISALRKAATFLGSAVSHPPGR